MPKQLTIRGVPDEVAHRLLRLSRSRRRSLNATVVEILAGAVSFNERRQHLERYVTWEEPDKKEFDEALQAQRVIDEDAWN